MQGEPAFFRTRCAGHCSHSKCQGAFSMGIPACRGNRSRTPQVRTAERIA
ncbi:hypothetical protein AK973_1951 [Pseudomonas brassicacearum]|nr:hypothetical protein AK973_1951 [Pseudomonas brassicacearum]